MGWIEPQKYRIKDRGWKSVNRSIFRSQSLRLCPVFTSLLHTTFHWFHSWWDFSEWKWRNKERSWSISRREGRHQHLYLDWFLHMLAFQHELLMSPQHGKWSLSSWWWVRTSSGLAFVGSKRRTCSASFSLNLFFGHLCEHRNWIDDLLSLEWDVKLVLRAPLFWMTDQHLYPWRKHRPNSPLSVGQDQQDWFGGWKLTDHLERRLRIQND